MDKRLLLALFLSFFVLTIWSTFNAPEIENKTAKAIENKDVVLNSIVSEDNLLTNIKNNTDIITKTYELKSEYLTATFSSTGGALKSLFINSEKVLLPLTDYFTLQTLEDLPFAVVKHTTEEIVFSVTVEGFTFLKSYVFDENKHNIRANISIQNNSSQPAKMKLNIKAFTIHAAHPETIDQGYFDKADDSRNGMLNEYSVKVDDKVIRKNNATKFKKGENKEKLSETIDWIGFRDRHFCSIVRPLDEVVGYKANVVDDESLEMFFLNNTVEIPPSETLSLQGEIFTGPQEVDVLKNFSTYKDIISYQIGGFFDIFAFGLGDPSAKGILVILKFVHKLVHSWGVAIIIVALLVCGATYPLTLKSMRSMKKVQAFQPEMNKIKEKYKNNPQKVNQEMMEFYKKHKINPLGGCLPMLLQMPIFYGVIQLLWRYVGFLGEPFLWIKDLSQPDRFYILPFSVPVIGNEINILPLIVFVLAIFQQKFSGKNVAVSDPNQAMQMKMMKIMFPAMIILFFYRFASAMALYFTIYYSFSTYTQWKMSKDRVVVT